MPLVNIYGPDTFQYANQALAAVPRYASPFTNVLVSGGDVASNLYQPHTTNIDAFDLLLAATPNDSWLRVLITSFDDTHSYNGGVLRFLNQVQLDGYEFAATASSNTYVTAIGRWDADVPSTSATEPSAANSWASGDYLEGWAVGNVLTVFRLRPTAGVLVRTQRLQFVDPNPIIRANGTNMYGGVRVFSDSTVSLSQLGSFEVGFFSSPIPPPARPAQFKPGNPR